MASRGRISYPKQKRIALLTAELAAVLNSLYNVARASRVIAVVIQIALNVRCAMENEGNPYSAPEYTHEPLCAKCPVCEHAVRRIRFLIPFGHCRGCGNYLTVRNDASNESLRGKVLLILSLSGLLFDRLGLIAITDVPLLKIYFLYVGLCAVYDRVVGKLVPAVWWGFFSLRDDPRLNTQSDKNSISG